jgi:rubrerythrin
MFTLRAYVWFSAVVAFVLLAPSVCGASGGPNLATLDRLQAAYRAEMNAQARYLAFAVKADDEGYRQVANLFRAVARGEQILYTNHYDAIKALGGTPEDVTPVEPKAGTTKENLEQSANKNAADQFDSDYATFAKAAHAEGNREAAKTFEYARAVEAQNFRLFAAAAQKLDSMRGGPRGYYICGASGYVSVTMENCSSPDWEKVK